MLSARKQAAESRRCRSKREASILSRAELSEPARRWSGGSVAVIDVRSVRHDRLVPRISAFYGIIIYMYRPDHPPPHFHAQYGEHVAQLRLDTLEVLNGSLPPRGLRLVRERAALHMVELAENGELAQALEPLVEIDPLP